MPDPIPRHVVLGVTGGIAAYKACSVVNGLKATGNEVRVVMTKNAARFVTPLTFETLSENPVAQSMWRWNRTTEHITIAQWADIFVVAPATANTIAKLAMGRYAFRELYGLRQECDKQWEGNVEFGYGLEDCDYHKDKVKI